MNGDLKIIYDTVLEVRAQQLAITKKVDVRHEENQKIFMDLPCKVHNTHFFWMRVIGGSLCVSVAGIYGKLFGWW